MDNNDTQPGMVWSIFDNCWVTQEYWAWLNGRRTVERGDPMLKYADKED